MTPVSAPKLTVRTEDPIREEATQSLQPGASSAGRSAAITSWSFSNQHISVSKGLVMLNSEFTEGTVVDPLHPFVVELWGSRNAPACLPPQPHTFLQPAVGSASLTLRSLFCPNTVIGVEPLPRDPEECELKVRGVSFNFQHVDSFNTQEQNERKSHTLLKFTVSRSGRNFPKCDLLD